MLVFLMILSTVVLFVPGITAAKAKQSAWIVPLVIPVAVGYLSMWTAWKLGQRFPGNTLPQYSEILLGKILGKAAGTAYVFFLLVMNVLVIREFSEFITTTTLPETPILALNAGVVLVGGYAAAKGIEVIARMTQFVLPLFISTLLIILAFGVPKMDLGYLLPVLEDGIKPVVLASVVPASWLGEIGVLVMLLPMVNKPAEIKKKCSLALLGVAGFLAADTLVTLTVFGPELTAEFTFPFWSLARNIEFRNYIQRVESLLLVLWVAGIVVKVSLFSYLASLAAAQILNLKTYKPAVYPTAFVLVLASTYFIKNLPLLAEVLEKYWPPFGLAFELLLPFFLLSVAFIRKKGRGGSR